MKLKVLWKVFSKGVVDNLPTILSVVAVGGLVGSVATAIIDTPKAIDKITETKVEKAEKLEREVDEADLEAFKDENGYYSLTKIKLTPWEYISILTPIYWKTGACMILTGTCILMSNHINQHRIAMLIAGLKLKDKEFKEYKEKVKELFGEKKAEEVKHELAQDWIMNAPTDEDKIVSTHVGGKLFYEPLTHTYFRSNEVAVGQAITRANAIGQGQGYLTVAEYCYELDLPLKDTYLEDGYQWRYKPGSFQDLLDWRQGEYVRNPDTGEVALVLNLNRDPDYTG